MSICSCLPDISNSTHPQMNSYFFQACSSSSVPVSKTATTTYTVIQARNQGSCLTLSFPHLPNADKSCRFYLPPKYPLNTTILLSSNSAAGSPECCYVSLDHCNSFLVSSPLNSPFSKHFPYGKGGILLTLKSDHASNHSFPALLLHNEYGT